MRHMAKPMFVLDGRRCGSRSAFFAEISRIIFQGGGPNGNLDALNDMLRGGYGSPDGGFILEWRDSASARDGLGAALFGVIVDIFRDHGPGGTEAEDGVELILA
jgi:hypothetical protein